MTQYERKIANLKRARDMLKDALNLIDKNLPSEFNQTTHCELFHSVEQLSADMVEFTLSVARKKGDL